jgi:hypothetical protein
MVRVTPPTRRTRHSECENASHDQKVGAKPIRGPQDPLTLRHQPRRAPSGRHSSASRCVSTNAQHVNGLCLAHDRQRGSNGLGGPLAVLQAIATTSSRGPSNPGGTTRTVRPVSNNARCGARRVATIRSARRPCSITTLATSPSTLIRPVCTPCRWVCGARASNVVRRLAARSACSKRIVGTSVRPRLARWPAAC